MKRWTCFLALVLVAAAGCMNESPVAVDPASSPPELIPPAPATAPFYAHQENTIVVVGQIGTVLYAEFPGVVQGLHIGSGTIFAESQVDFSTFPFTQTTQSVITAADGDELHANLAGFAYPVVDFPDSVVFDGTFTFVGGTGRFATATGEGTYSGSANTAGEGAGQYDMVGVISR